MNIVRFCKIGVLLDANITPNIDDKNCQLVICEQIYTSSVSGVERCLFHVAIP